MQNVFVMFYVNIMLEISAPGTVLDSCVAGSNLLFKYRHLGQIAVRVGYFVKEIVISSFSLFVNKYRTRALFT